MSDIYLSPPDPPESDELEPDKPPVDYDETYHPDLGRWVPDGSLFPPKIHGQSF